MCLFECVCARLSERVRVNVCSRARFQEYTMQLAKTNVPTRKSPRTKKPGRVVPDEIPREFQGFVELSRVCGVRDEVFNDVLKMALEEHSLPRMTKGAHVTNIPSAHRASLPISLVRYKIGGDLEWYGGLFREMTDEKENSINPTNQSIKQ